MALFQKSVLKQHLNYQDKSVTEKAYKKYVKYFQNQTIQENIKTLKEEEYQGIFLTELFVNILGYTLSPKPNYNLVAEYKNLNNSRKADGAILKDETAIAVIELKGTKTKDLESIRRQAFDYKANQKGCVYVITSNFEKLRFYINDATEFLDFDLFELTQQDFDLLYLCLSKESIFNDLPQKIKNESVANEEKITKAFYKDYSLFKRELYRDLVKRNGKRLKNAREHELGSDLDNEQLQKELDRLEKNVKLALFKKSQKLIDRFLFIFFGEDRGLLPPNSTKKILQEWEKLKELNRPEPLYDTFKIYFKYLDKGRQGTNGKAEIYAYNGGLFKPDSILDSLEIDDELLHKHTDKLEHYDFDSQIDVNILGHIFENSLNEIESVNAEIEGGDFDKQKSKRKKDGVFYTPKYITKYMVENTIGKLCEEKKTELGFSEEEYYKSRKGRQKATLEKLISILDEYRDWLLQLTICDPACGSGAFLNQALDFLIKEHTYIDELKTRLLGGGIVLSDIENTILENNIYGVDLNEESVEIAKLSLWLRTAQPKRKLNNLSSNIKCGNSLIESKTVAGDKAFNWQEAFSKVFEKGGFDVIIGNPPYVRVQNIDNESVLHFNKQYTTAYKNYDLYVLFTEKIDSLINKNGISSFIMPKKFVTTDYGKKLKEYLYKNNLLKCFVDFDTLQVFKDATTYTGIFFIDKSPKETFDYSKIKLDPINVAESNYVKIPYKSIENESWILLPESEARLFSKIKSQGNKLIDISEKLFQGLVTGKDSVFILENTTNGLYSKETKKYYDFKIDNELLRPLLKGGEIGRYNNPTSNNYIIYPYSISGEKQELLEIEKIKFKDSKIHEYLIENENLLRSREKGKFDNENWYSYSRNQNIAQMPKPKILTQVLAKKSTLTIDKEGKYCFVGGGTAGGYGLILKNNIALEQILPILNSKLLQWYLQQYASPFSGGYFAYSKGTMSNFPIKIENSLNLDSFTKKISGLVILKENLSEKFILFITSSFKTTNLSKKLQNWHELEFGEFIKELNKAIKKENKERVKEDKEEIKTLTKLDEMDWMEVFETKKAEVNQLKAQIDATDKEIDQMVYKLYELTPEEIEIVENS